MKKVLILCLHRPDRTPSQRFRFEQYLGYLENNGYSFDFSYLLDEEDDKVFYKPGNYLEKLRIALSSTARRIKNMVQANQYNLVFVSRQGFMLGTAFFEKAIARKVPMIFDLDDAIWMHQISEGSQKITSGNKNLSFLKNPAKTSQLIQSADLVFAGNQFLADYSKRFNQSVVIIPTTINTDKYKPVSRNKTGNDAVCIGWSGSFSTVEMFRYSIPALVKIKDKYGEKVSFRIIGDANYYCNELQVQGLPWKEATELEDLSKIDIGIMPLPDNDWTKGKCGLKGLQYMALKIPTLMSPVGVNTTIIQHGHNGFLPRTEEEWVEQISSLVENEELRKQVGEAGRETVVKDYSVERWKGAYLQHFDNISSKAKS